MEEKEFYIASVDGNKAYQNQKLTTKTIELILLFWVNEDHRGTKMMSEAAQTRRKNIENSTWYNSSIHKIYNPPIQSVDEIITIVKNYIDKFGGVDKVVMREIGIFSHSGNDGPITYNKKVKYPVNSNWPHQMNMDGWGKISFNWKNGAKCVFYGCNSGWKDNGFVKRLSDLDNFKNKNVEVWGQTTSSYPSFYPDFRVTSVARNMDTGWNLVGRNQTYMVSGNREQGLTSTFIIESFTNNVDQLTDKELKKFPKANPMNCFKNGNYDKTSHQGYFNDHRKKDL